MKNKLLIFTLVVFLDSAYSPLFLATQLGYLDVVKVLVKRVKSVKVSPLS